MMKTPRGTLLGQRFQHYQARQPLRHDERSRFTSIADEERISERGGLRQPRAKAQALLNACSEDDVEMHSSEIGDNPYNISHCFEALRAAHALRSAAHLPTLRLLYTLWRATQTLSPTSWGYGP